MKTHKSLFNGNIMLTVAALSACTLVSTADAADCCAKSGADYPIRPADITNVTVTGGFWLPRLETNRLSTLKTDFEKCELARIPNFRNAAGRKWGTFKGIPFDDSDVYKVIEGAAYVLATHPDAELEKYVDSVIAAIAGAQERDGYLYTARTLGFTYKGKNGKPEFRMMGPTRWSHLAHSHELYNVGHLYEAAVAWYEATGKRSLLDVAVKSADLVDRTFGTGATQISDTSGHEEIELALCKLYRATREPRYLELAKYFLDRRGKSLNPGDAKVFTQSGDLADGKAMDAPGAYLQAHMPVTEQREAVGHAVRATYLYCGMADVAALAGNADYIKAIDAIWDNVVSKKLHLNGSVGARHRGEAFGANYELPNETAYLETCAGIGNALWNQRMFLMHGEAKYIDVMELGLYNGIISGVSISGDEFFYPNPLASKGGYRRSKWFGCSCCPVNVVRFIPQIVQFAYATRDDAAYVNLFVASDATLRLKSGDVRLSQKTDYPWNGDVRIAVEPAADGARFALNVRIPGWCTGRPVPSDLYTQTVPGSLADFSVKVNGRMADVSPVKGYCVVEREWKKGDVVEISMNMPVRRVKAHDMVAADRGRLAVMRGPVLYCAEGADNGGYVLCKAIPADAAFRPATCDILGSEFPALSVSAEVAGRSIGGDVCVKWCEMKLIPYFAWCHRGAGEMQTWFPTEPRESDAVCGVKFSASHINDEEKRFGTAVLSGAAPENSGDHGIPRITFWPHKGTEEWVAYEFDKPEAIGGVDVYWFDDRDRNGGCRIPAEWKVETRPSVDAPWRQVGNAGPVVRDGFSRAEFPGGVKAQALRITVRNQNGFSGGILKVAFRKAEK